MRDLLGVDGNDDKRHSSLYKLDFIAFSNIGERIIDFVCKRVFIQY